MKLSKLTEQKIKKSTLSFLKSYYKHRPRNGETNAEIDMRGQGGIIADGFLQFEDDNGQNFVSTFEATSNNTKDEVNFKVQFSKLAWDAWAAASVVVAVWFFGKYYYNINFLQNEGFTRMGFILLLGTFFIAFTLVFLLRRWKRYRYIYAIEQFKQYHADEQWVSIGTDVFPSPEDNSFKELKEQCVFNGIGLIQVDDELKPQLIITPSRQDTFKKQRRMVEFLSLNEATKRLPDIQPKKLLDRFFPNRKKANNFLNAGSVGRFMPRNSAQISIAGVAWILIMSIYLIELDKMRTKYIDQEDYTDLVLAQVGDGDPEITFSIIEDTFLIQPYNKQTIPYLELVQGQVDNEQVASIQKRGYDVVIGLENEFQFTIYSCERFYNFKDPKYIVEEGVYLDLDQAIDRVEFLSDQGISSTLLWLGCFEKEGRGYALYFDLIQNSRDEAADLYYKYNDEIKSVDRIEKSLSIRTLMPVK